VLRNHVHVLSCFSQLCRTCCVAVHIDISRVFNSVLPQQCQPADSFTGASTICAIYTKWYVVHNILYIESFMWLTGD